MNENEKVLMISARIRQLASSLKSMGVDIDHKELATDLLNGPPDRLDNLISALVALGGSNDNFAFSLKPL